MDSCCSVCDCRLWARPSRIRRHLREGSRVITLQNPALSSGVIRVEDPQVDGLLAVWTAPAPRLERAWPFQFRLLVQIGLFRFFLRSANFGRYAFHYLYRGNGGNYVAHYGFVLTKRFVAGCAGGSGGKTGADLQEIHRMSRRPCSSYQKWGIARNPKNGHRGT
jgi:hypothetical protein